MAKVARPRLAGRSVISSKLKICLKELNESRIWLKFIIQSELQPENLLTNLHNECDELCRIINASIKTTTTPVNHSQLPLTIHN
ncbi:MAG: four helix bundle protein [Chloroflexi bacterium]|nr:four helix bundle protein [Chloroflexota bacterium]